MVGKPRARGGIVGSGFPAKLHCQGIRRVHGTEVELAGHYSPTRSNARRVAGPRDVATFESVEALRDAVGVAPVCACLSAERKGAGVPIKAC